MKKLLLLAAGLFLSISIFAQSLPNTPIKDASGKTIAFNKTVTPGKVTLISFWANWCVPCKAEITNINKKLATWKKELDFDYQIVSLDDTRALAAAKSYVASKGYTFPSYYDVNSDLKRSLNFANVPFTIIVDKTGKVAFQHTGYEVGSEEVLFKKVKEIAGK